MFYKNIGKTYTLYIYHELICSTKEDQQDEVDLSTVFPPREGAHETYGRVRFAVWPR